jgi:rare lipoprotein A
LSGKHADSGTSRPAPRGFSTRITRLARFLPRRSVPLIAALTIAGVVLGASVAAMTLGPATDTPAVSAHVDAVPSVSASHTSDERASRSGLRVDEPSPTPSASSSPAAPPTKKPNTAPSPPSGGGNVISSGTCGASFYSDGQKTANGENFDPNAFTAAHKTLPFNTRVRVTNQANGKSTTVRINDRGPYAGGRCLDLSRASFAAIASLSAGVITVKYEVLS